MAQMRQIKPRVLLGIGPLSRCLTDLALALSDIATADACRVGFCGLLFLLANVMKKLLAKLFSSHFYKATHYEKMQDALRKEFFIVALSQPREDRQEDDPMKHKPSTLAELRTKSFAAGGALVSILASSAPLCIMSIPVVKRGQGMGPAPLLPAILPPTPLSMWLKVAGPHQALPLSAIPVSLLLHTHVKMLFCSF